MSIIVLKLPKKQQQFSFTMRPMNPGLIINQIQFETKSISVVLSTKLHYNSRKSLYLHNEFWLHDITLIISIDYFT